MISGQYKVFIPLEMKFTKTWGSSNGKYAREWKRHWDNLLALCKSLKKSGVPYEVEYHFGAEVAYAVIYAGNAVRQQELKLAA